jgi:DNA-binding beta-propeller fold protein YncE
MHRAFLSLLVLIGASSLTVLACGGSGALAPPRSDNQADDPCDPGGGGTTNSAAPPVDAGAQPVVLPGGDGGIGFDDLRFSSTLSTLLVPAGRTGDLDLVDPSSEEVTPISGFATAPTYTDDSVSVTSADEGNTIIYATDRTSSTLMVIDQKAIVSHVALAATPGYVRYAAPTNEVWVTEPSAQQIEVFTLGTSPSTAPVHSTVIPVSGGPEFLEIDAATKRAYTNTTTATVAIDVAGHTVVSTWPNGCATSRGLALDSTNGWVMAACEEGMVVVLAAQGGATIGTVPVGAGVEQITYDPQRLRLYVPSPTASAMSVVSLGTTGSPTVLGSIQTTSDAHCAVTSGGGEVYVCAPSRGVLLFNNDPF